MSIERTAIIIIASYLIGSIPTSIWICRMLKGIDIRDYGSKNAGATNVYRVMGIKVAVLVGAIDTLKGVLAVIISQKYAGNGNELPVIAGGIAAILGHVYTVFAGFKGGKGILVAMGVFGMILPYPAFTSLFIWAVVTFSTKYVSVGSMTAVTLLPFFTYMYNHTGITHTGLPLKISTILLAVLVLFTHRANIKRLMNGTENKIGKKKTEEKA